MAGNTDGILMDFTTLPETRQAAVRRSRIKSVHQRSRLLRFTCRGKEIGVFGEQPGGLPLRIIRQAMGQFGPTMFVGVGRREASSRTHGATATSAPAVAMAQMTEFSGALANTSRRLRTPAMLWYFRHPQHD